jgi:hypothetical protein
LASDGDVLSVSLHWEADELRRLLNELSDDDIQISKLSVHEPTLDDVFFSLTGRSAPTEHAAQPCSANPLASKHQSKNARR